ncbi:hypothetical protein [Vibrio aquimaris]|uniref:Superfamily II DNA and RNA helicase n=1 Tax=Vibrio aquimaris TaxID=2587862 RepID=A0A5P9CJ65_9VIBR|nr:hypothetical protein [Vibrio aquimaris]QFT26358.1 hypothetical protein FIV01_07950 [Vibrio aquimaris]
MFHLHTTNRLAVTHHHWAHQSESIKRLAGLSDQKQWILFTAECPRPSLDIFSSYNVNCGNMIHLKPSKTLCERAIVEKAIKSRNASAIVASNKISTFDQKVLSDLAAEYGCQVIFIEKGHMHYH